MASAGRLPAASRSPAISTVTTIINKITTNTVEIASIRIYARALQSSVEIARLGPAARNEALTIPLSAATMAPRHLAVPPRPSRAGSGSRVMAAILRRASSFVSIIARRASASLPWE
jgi:hypothetical protein